MQIPSLVKHEYLHFENALKHKLTNVNTREEADGIGYANIQRDIDDLENPGARATTGQTSSRSQTASHTQSEKYAGVFDLPGKLEPPLGDEDDYDPNEGEDEIDHIVHGSDREKEGDALYASSCASEMSEFEHLEEVCMCMYSCTYISLCFYICGCVFPFLC